MKKPHLFFVSAWARGVSIAAIVLAFTGGASPSAAAAVTGSLPAALQGTYKIVSFKVLFNGQNKTPGFTPVTIKLGPKGLKAVTTADVQRLIQATGGGTQAHVAFVSTTPTTSVVSLTGKLGDMTVTTGKAVSNLNTSGFTIIDTLSGTSRGQPATAKTTLVMKKQ